MVESLEMLSANARILLYPCLTSFMDDVMEDTLRRLHDLGTLAANGVEL